MGPYSATKRNKLLIRAAAWVNLQSITLSEEKPIPKGYIRYDSIYIGFLTRQNWRNGEQIYGCQELRRAWEQDRSGHGYRRATGGILVVMGMLCILTVSVSKSRLGYCLIVLEVATVGENWVKGIQDLPMISYNCM